MIHDSIRGDVDASAISGERGGKNLDRRVIRHRHSVAGIIQESAGVHSYLTAHTYTHAIATGSGDVETVQVDAGRRVHIQSGKANTVSLNRGSLTEDRKSTRLNSSHPSISYAVFCLKK